MSHSAQVFISFLPKIQFPYLVSRRGCDADKEANKGTAPTKHCAAWQLRVSVRNDFDRKNNTCQLRSSRWINLMSLVRAPAGAFYHRRSSIVFESHSEAARPLSVAFIPYGAYVAKPS